MKEPSLGKKFVFRETSVTLKRGLDLGIVCGEVKGNALEAKIETPSKEGRLPLNEDGSNFDGGRTISGFELSSPLIVKLSVKSSIWRRVFCDRADISDTEANNAVAVNTKDLILKAEKKGFVRGARWFSVFVEEWCASRGIIW